MTTQADPSALTLPPTSPIRWSPAARALFRFAFCYFILYSGATVMTIIPGGDYVAQQYGRFWQVVIPWVAAQLKPPVVITVFPNGSGDTTYNYFEVACYAIVAIAGALLWSVLDRRRPAYPRLHDRFRTFLRYGLAATMLGYGMAKVIKTQFPFPGPDRLLEPYGESSPMGLLWTFMGFSTSYTVFAGAAECLGGLLLLCRRTTLLGSLVVAGVMANVVLLNFSYDVPVKLFSSHLLLMSLILLLPDLRRLTAVFVLNRPVPAADLGRICLSRRGYVTAMIIKALAVLYIVGGSVFGGISTWNQYGPGKPAKPLQGLYEVSAFTRNGQEVPPLYTDPSRWRRFTVGAYDNATVHGADDSRQRLGITVNAAAHTLTLAPYGQTETKWTLAYSEPQVGHLTLDGQFQGQALHVEMARREDSTFPLVSRGFHWINEYPFNR